MPAENPSVTGMPQTVRAPRLDREARVFLRMFNAFSARRHISTYSVGQLRQIWLWTSVALGRRDPVASVTEHDFDGPAGSIQVRIFRPESVDRELPALLWVHGGAFLVGGIETSDSICRTIANAGRVVVVAVRYRLAPEHDLYAGREDVYVALKWLASEARSLGIDPHRIAIGGDSAGGNIATAVAQQSQRLGGPKLRLQVLCYPATRVGHSFPSRAENSAGFFLTSENMDWMHDLYAAAVDLNDPWISPGLAADQLATMPPAVVVTAGYDPLRDDGLDYTAQLRRAGVPVELLHYPGQFHGFLNFDAVLGAAREGLRRIGRSLAIALHGGAVANRTMEIGAVRPRGAQADWRDTVGDLAAGSVIFWESMSQWFDVGLGMVSPMAQGTYRSMGQPWLTPAGWARSYVSSQLEPLSARQTYPRTAADSPPR